MLEAVYGDRFYITGTIEEVRARLRDHCEKYKTLGDLVKSMLP